MRVIDYIALFAVLVNSAFVGILVYVVLTLLRTNKDTEKALLDRILALTEQGQQAVLTVRGLEDDSVGEVHYVDEYKERQLEEVTYET